MPLLFSFRDDYLSSGRTNSL